MNDILIKKNHVIFFLFKVRTLKKLYSQLQVCINFLTAAQFKLIPIKFKLAYTLNNSTE